MKGRQFKFSAPSSIRKESKPPSVYPKIHPKRNVMDLSYPIFKLETRAEWERECADLGVDGRDGPLPEEQQARMKREAMERAKACEEAARILKQHRVA